LLAQLEQNTLIGSLAEWLRDNLTATSAQLQDWLVSATQVLMKSLAASGGNFLLGALNTAIHFFMMLFLCAKCRDAATLWIFNRDILQAKYCWKSNQFR
jgi:predicted PurR-regulated permease PerM